MKPYGMVIAKHLGELWQDSQDRNMLQCNIVSTLKSFVEAMGTDGQPWHDELLSIVAYCTDLAHVCKYASPTDCMVCNHPNNAQPAHVYLLEDGLGLWTALLITSAQPSESLVALFPRAVSLLEGNSEHVRDIIRIVDLYVAMYPQVVDVCTSPPDSVPCAVLSSIWLSVDIVVRVVFTRFLRPTDLEMGFAYPSCCCLALAACLNV